VTNEKGGSFGVKEFKKVVECLSQKYYSFNLMNEFNKIKIPIPLMELAMPAYKEELLKFMGSSPLVIHSNSINL
jgi:hypothetical protein